MLGFHAKGLDQLIAIKGLAKMGSLGPAIGQCEADSEQARSLLSLCGKAGGRAVAFGEKVFEAGRERLKNHPLKLDDIRGFVLGFHAKGLDQLIAIKGLAKMGSLGPAIGQCRVFFEAFLSIGYILKEDTEKRIRAYQKYCLRRSIKSIREIIKIIDGYLLDSGDPKM